MKKAQSVSTNSKIIKNNAKIDRFLLSMMFLVFVFIIGFALSTYSVRMENKLLKEELASFKNDTFNHLTDLGLESQLHSVNLREINEDLLVKTNKISVIEESLDPENSRWAKIKLVRESVKKVIGEFGYKKVPDIQGLTSYSGSVVEFSEQYDVPVALILAITTQESAFNVGAVSHSGAQGLLQIMPGTAREISQDIGQRYYSMFKIRDSVHFGTWYLWKMMDRFNSDVDLAIRAYNCGPICVEKVVSGDWPDYPRETQNYVQMVKFWMVKYESMGL